MGSMVGAIDMVGAYAWLLLLCPAFVTFLLTCVSGLPMLEKAADKKWGGQED